MNNNKVNFTNITIPKELYQMTNKTIQSHTKKRKSFISLVATIAALAVFTVGLNANESFAENMTQIPIIKNLASVLTFRSYEFQADGIKADVKLPVVDLEDDHLEIFINETINTKVSETLREATMRVEEYKTAYLETGGTEEGYKEKNMSVVVDTEVFLQNEEYLSFRVFTHESLAAVYAENLYFTINIKTQTLVSLSDLLGTNYQTTIKKVVQIDYQSNPELYFEDIITNDWQPRADVDFYLSSDHLVSVVFQKYELAPGTFGRLEYQIPYQ